MDDIAIKQFKRDFIIKTLMQQTQFEQWLRFTFYLNAKLQEEYDTIYQDAFYVKVYEVLTKGLNYAIEVHDSLTKGDNVQKMQWYSKLINGLNKIKSDLDESEFLYIEYRRHNASHIFQNSYEHIQDNLRIKKIRKNKDLKEINDRLKSMVNKYGSDRNIDDYLNNKLQPELTKLYENLINP
ncbi:hypothetical protein JW824_11035 [bacterium]|nr:hypothetical protein [bacterium]